MWKKILTVLVNRENWLAILLALILLAIVIYTSDARPAWIYQGF